MKGLVFQSTGIWYQVKIESSGDMMACRIKGKFRMEGLTTTNPVAVGDKVIVEQEAGLDTGVITKILPRDNYIIRQSPRHRMQQHIIAANLDQVLLLLTFNKPRTSIGFIDRFLATAEMYKVPVVLVFNKQDMYRPKDFKKYEKFKEIYEKLGYQTLLTSALNGFGMKDLDEVMKGKTSLISGYSGVGKSTLINHILPDVEIATRAISNFNNKGVHTTTYSTMYELPNGGTLIDTPGVKGFFMVHLEPEEVGHYFREMQPLIQNCQFNNCMHRDEPKCAVKTAVENGELAFDRYKNYLSILENVESVNYWERD